MWLGKATEGCGWIGRRPRLLIVKIDTNDGVGSEVLSLLYHLLIGGLFGTLKHLLVGAGAATDNVPQPGGEISKRRWSP